MKKSFNTKLLFFIIATLFGIVLSVPSLFQTQGPKVVLGLDLQGGLNLLLGVKTEEAVKTRYVSLASQINYYALDEQILLDGLNAREDSIGFVEGSILSEFLNFDDIYRKEFLKEINYPWKKSHAEIINIIETLLIYH